MAEVRYIRVRWRHNNSNEPELLYSELGADRCEVRKVEVWADGRRGLADQTTELGETRLGVGPLPPLEEIAADPEFELEVIEAREFESEWAKASAEMNNG